MDAAERGGGRSTVTTLAGMLSLAMSSGRPATSTAGDGSRVVRAHWLASGNPTLLFLLCRAVALALAARGGSTRRLDTAALDQTWASDELSRSARRLLFERLQTSSQSQAVLRVIVELASPGEVIDHELVFGALHQADPLRDHAWLMRHVQVLVDYDLLHADDRGIRLAASGVTQLVCRWCAEPDL